MYLALCLRYSAQIQPCSWISDTLGILGERSGAKVSKNPTQKHGVVQELMESEIMNTQKPDMVHILRRQLDPSIEMLKEVIELCPNELWYAENDTPPIWEQVYHTLFWFNAWLRDWSKPIEYPKFHVEEALEMKRPPTGNISKEVMGLVE